MSELDRLQKVAVVAAAIGVVLCVIGLVLDATEFFRSYLLAFLFWISLALGSLGIRLLHNVVGGKWGVLIGGFLVSGLRTLPLMALLALPLLAGIPALYEWAHPEAVAHDPLLQHKTPYLNVPFFVVRTLLYFAIWMLLGYLFQKRAQTGFTRARVVSAPGLIIFAFSVTFAAVDWIMSLEPHWFSTIYGAIFLVGQTLQTFAFCIALLALLSHREPFASILDPSHFHDLGNLLLAFTALWAYTSFSQFLIIWSGHIPEETVWYVRRSNGVWQFVSVVLVAFHFAVPFAILLSRKMKRQGHRLAVVAIWIIGMRLVDLVYWTEPAYEHQDLLMLWVRAAALLGIGGLWLAFFTWQLRRQQPIVDVRDPRLAVEGVVH